MNEGNSGSLNTLKILVLEDSLRDAELLSRE